MKTEHRPNNKDIFAVSLMAFGALMILAGVVGFFEAVIFSLPWWLALIVFGLLAMLIAGVIG